jgi:hypothetical protein
MSGLGPLCGPTPASCIHRVLLLPLLANFSDMARCLALVCNWAKSGRERQGLNAGRCPLYLSSWPRLLLEDPLHHACPDAKFPADLEDAVTAGLQFENSRLHGRLYRTPAELGPIRPRASQTGIDPLSNDPPLELDKYAQHLKHRPAAGG